MITNRSFLVVVAIAFPFVLLGCSSSSSNKDTNMQADVPTDVQPDVPADVPADVPTDVTADVPVDVPTDTPVDVQLGTFKATLIEFGSNPPAGVEGAELAVIDESTGKATGQTVTSGANGAVEAQLPVGIKVGFKAMATDYHDTYQFGISSDAQDEILYIVTETLYTLAPALAGLEVDTTKAIVGGAIYWVSGSNAEEMVGCATVESTPAGDYRYFDPATGRPTSLENADQTSKTLSYFLVANIPAGTADSPAQVAVDAMVGGASVGTTTIWAIEGAICIQNVYATGAANPTPGDCTK
jgi:hypothetical protein